MKNGTTEFCEWCQENGMDNIYIWPDGDTPKRIYEEGGFRGMETRKAGRAVFEAELPKPVELREELYRIGGKIKQRHQT